MAQNRSNSAVKLTGSFLTHLVLNKVAQRKLSSCGLAIWLAMRRANAHLIAFDPVALMRAHLSIVLGPSYVDHHGG